MARCGNIYGGGDLHWSRLIPGTIRSLHRQEVPHIRSDGTLTRDYIYVEDVVGAYLLLAQQASCEEIQGQAFNFGSAQPFSVLEIVAIIQKLMGLPDLVPKIHDAVAAEIKHQSLNSLKAQQALSWQVRWPLEEGLQETIKWYAHYFEQVCCV
jgi:CDP-glucose 4,6-dehydratase